MVVKYQILVLIIINCILVLLKKHNRIYFQYHDQGLCGFGQFNSQIDIDIISKDVESEPESCPHIDMTTDIISIDVESEPESWSTHRYDKFLNFQKQG